MFVEDTPEAPQDDETPAPNADAPEVESDAVEADTDVFTREYVEELRQENGKHRQRAQSAEKRLIAELVRATGLLADPSDFTDFDSTYLDDPDKLHAAINALIEAKPHLKARKVAGDVGQGKKGSQPPQSFAGLFN